MNIGQIVDTIRRTNKENKLVVFIGAGVSMNSGYPSWQELVRSMDRVIKFSSKPDEKTYSNDELLRIPQYYKEFSKSLYQQHLVNVFGNIPSQSNLIINSILELNPHHIITTNFDYLIETSIREINQDPVLKRKYKSFAMVKKDTDLISTDKSNLVIKMHGDTEAFEYLVLSENDYLNYSTTHCLIETFIKSLLIDHTFIFIGYSVGDYNLKLILNWFENIVSTYKIKRTNRRRHYFINPNNKPMSKYDKLYFSSKNIDILESRRLPSKYKHIEVNDLSDNRGKNIYRVLKYLTATEADARTIKYVCKELEPLKSYSRIMYQDLLYLLCGFNNQLYQLIGDDLYFDARYKVDDLMAVAVSILRVPNSTSEDYNFIRDIFIKSGVNKVIFVDDEYTTEYVINANMEQNSLYDFFVTKDYKNLRIRLENTSCAIEKIHINAFLGNRDIAEKLVKDLGDKNSFSNLIEHMIFLLNSRHYFIDGYTHPEEIIELLSKEEKKYITTICEMNDGMNSTYYDLSNIVIDMQKKYSPYANSEVHEIGVQNSRYKSMRTQIVNIMKFLIMNNIYSFGSLLVTYGNGSLKKTFELYVDNLLYFQSSSCSKTKYEQIVIDIDDLIIITSYLQYKDLELIISKYSIAKIDLSQECINYLLITLSNIFDELTRAISINERSSFYLSQVSLTICSLLKIIDLAEKDKVRLVEISCRIFKLVNLNRDDYNYFIISDLFTKLQNIIYPVAWKSNNVLFVRPLEDTLNCILDQFINEVKTTGFSNIYNIFIEQHQIIIFLTKLIARQRVKIDVPILDSLISICKQYRIYEDIFIHIYPVANGDIKHVIKKIISDDLLFFSVFNIFLALENMVVEYDSRIEDHLVQLCSRFTANNQFESYWDSPLYVVLRLKEKGIIRTLDGFQKFAMKDNFFMFVCFPNEFDYNLFDVNWYSWLDIQEYRDSALSNSKEILRKKFVEAIRNGTTENIKATYYRFFYEPNMAELPSE